VHELTRSVLAYVRKHHLIHAGDRLAVAVSGGADSVALLRLMLELQDELGIVLSVAHLNHQLRGAESDADARFVRELATERRLEVISESREVRAYAAQKRLSLEAAAREVRYEFFHKLLHAAVNRVATAHTLDDQAETVLLKVVRGAGTRGMAGIYRELALPDQPSSEPGNRVPADPSIIRPLLATRRSQLREYLAGMAQSWREDASNQDLRHTRNRIRHEILPRIEREVNPAASEVLAETAEIARAEEEYWEREIRRLLPQVWSHREQAFERNLLHGFPLAVQRRLVKAASESLGLHLAFSQVAEILALGREGECSELPGHWSAKQHGRELQFRRGAEPPSAYEYRLKIPGETEIVEAGVCLETLFVSLHGKQTCEGQPLLDRRFSARVFTIRNWRAGERFWPAHRKAPKRIKELLQDCHITGAEKRSWPVVASGNDIVWLRGFGLGRDFQAKGREGILIREITRNRKPTPR
jgi:tRNA(Ile)-lysidine synthase